MAGTAPRVILNGMMSETPVSPELPKDEAMLLRRAEEHACYFGRVGAKLFHVEYRYDQKYYRNNSARADFCSSLRQVIRALQNGAVQSKNNFATVRC